MKSDTLLATKGNMEEGIEGMPLVTVGMVTYNSGKYVHDAISSVLHSGYTNLELIICDDCSTDNTWEISSSFSDPRIRAYRNKHNLGEYRNRNQAIDLANGEYFIFIDGDDMIFPCSIGKVVRMLRAFPDAGFCIAASGRNDIIYPYVFSPELVYKLYLYGISFFNHSFAQAVFKTDILRKVKLSENLIAGDTDLFLRLSTRYNLLVINAPLSWWRVTPNQASKKLKGVNGLLEHFKILCGVLALEDVPLKKVQKEFLIQRYTNIISRLLVVSLLKLRINNVKKLWPYFNFSTLFPPKQQIPDLKLPTPEAPWFISLNRNPFSSTYVNENKNATPN